MKKTTSLWLMLMCLSFTALAQFPAPYSAVTGGTTETQSTAAVNFIENSIDCASGSDYVYGPQNITVTTSNYNGYTYYNLGSSELAYSSGPYFNQAGTPDLSIMESVTLGHDTYGAGVQISANNRIAEDIVLVDDYDITELVFYGYQSFTPTSPPTINAINVQIWDGDPSDPGSSVIWGDPTTNVLATVTWSGAYRVLETALTNTDRAIHRITVDATGLTLPAGTYWVDWQMGGTSTSGPWQPPVSILGQASTGNAQQSLAGAWQSFVDGVTGDQYGAPIEVFGTIAGGGSASVIIDFEGPGEEKGAYASGTVNLSGFDFDMTEALIGTLAGDFKNGVRSARFRGRDGSSMTMLEDKSDGLGTISFEYREYGTDGDQQPWAVEYSTNQGADWTQIGDPFTATDVVQTFSETVEVEGDVRIRIRIDSEPGTTGNRRMNLDDIELTDFVAEPAFARVQVIHNSADPAAEFVDVYLDDVLLLEDFEFRTSTAFVDVPAGTPVNIDVAPAGSSSSGDSIYNLTATLDEGETYLVIATGVIDPSQFDEAVNSPIDFSLEVYADAREAALDPADTDVLVHHGSTDAPTVDVVETSVPVGIIVDDISFSEFQGYLELIPDDYEIDITNEDGTVVVASYGVPLSTLALDGEAITVLASGFLDPTANQDGPAFGLWVSLAGGGPLVELPLLGGIPNEECDDAIALTCGDVVTGSTTGASNSGGNDAGDVFYSYTGSGDEEIVTISLCDGNTDYDSLLRVFTDCTLSDEIVFNDDSCGLQSELSFLSDGVSTYYIMVEGFGAQEGDFSLEISCSVVASNNNCDNAIALTCGETVTGSTLLASNSGGNPANDVFYSYTGSGNEETITISLCDGDTDYDSLLRVFSDCTLTNEIAVNDDFCGLQSELSFVSDGTSTYYIMVEGFGTSAGDFSLEINCVVTPPGNDLIVNAYDVDEFAQPYTDVGALLQYATNETMDPNGCAIAGTNGVWYKFTAEIDGTAEGSVVNPDGVTAVIFYEAPDEDVADETELTFSPEATNQCGPGNDNSITTVAGQSYYVFVLNTGGPSDVIIDLTNTILSAEDNTIDGFTFYPNPAMNVINVSANTMLDNVYMYNMLGQKVLDQNISATTSQLDVSNLASGTYLMKVSAEGQTGTYQIIKR